ncbi:hypothetical protein Tsubulata_047803, partial [Turnera subulata]
SIKAPRSMEFLIVKKPFVVSTYLLLAVYAFLFFFSTTVEGHANVPAVLAFGDSILDTGNNNYLPTITKSNFPPYGIDLPGRVPTGRFGDGRVFSDLIAEGLGVKGMLPPYLDPYLQDSELPTGVCFASAGSGLDDITARIQSIQTITDQLNRFKEYISRLRNVVGEQKANYIISKAVFLISSGNNDLGITYYGLHLRPLFGIDAYTSQLVTLASKLVKDLYNLGARKIAFMSTVPLGCLPVARTVFGGVTRNCVQFGQQSAELFNSKLASEIRSLNNNLPNSTIFYLDIFNPLLDLINNPEASGFEVADRGCCGTGTFEMGLAFCTPLNPFTCPNPSKFVFWDSAHPTERAYRTIVPEIVHKYASQFSA